MKNKLYSLPEAQKEAENLKQKVESGAASNYEEASNLLKKENDEQSSAKEGMMYHLRNGSIDAAIKIKDAFHLSEEFLQSPEVQSAAKKRMIDRLTDGYIDDAIKIKDTFHLSEEVVQPAAKEGMIDQIWDGYIDDAIKIKDAFNLSEEVFQPAAKEWMMYQLRYGFIDDAIKIKDAFHLSEEFLQSPEVQFAAKKRMIDHLRDGSIDDAIKIKDTFHLSGEVVQSVAKEGMIDHLRNGSIDNAIKIKDTFHLSEEVVQSAAKEKMIDRLWDGYIDAAIKIKDAFHLELNEEVEEIARIALVFSTSVSDFSELVITDPRQYTEDDLAKMWLHAKEFPTWGDDQIISSSFEAGVAVFGYRGMLEYIKRENLSLHDALHAFENILELYQSSHLGASEFYEHVLRQVCMDDREYAEGSAHHHLNAIAQSANTNIAETITKAQAYKNIERLHDLVETFCTPETVFASWANLKRYSDLEQLLGKTEALDQLQELKAQGNEALYAYVETLAFHPDSKVNMGAVMQFWQDPESFLSADASHTPQEVHNNKKPSNYICMPNLDLTATELRDALVEGDMDGLSAFMPLEIRYTIASEDARVEPLLDVVARALGSRKKNITGAARNPRKLFSELSVVLKSHGLSVADYLQGESLPDNSSLSQAIEGVLYDPGFGMERPLVKTREFVARISPKSDPEGAIAGDDTVNCMPFGDGKNTVYTFNPNTAQFVLRIVKSDGKERTIAQSVLTKDVDVKTPIPKVIEQLQQGGAHLESVLPEAVLSASPTYIACDNVEVSPNYAGKYYQRIIEAIFRDFFKEYIHRYGAAQGLDSEKVFIGQGYTDALSQLPAAPNTFAPQAPVSYSDKTGEKVYVLALESEKESGFIQEKHVQTISIKKKEPSFPLTAKGLAYLTFEDTLKVAYLEGKAYADNESLMQFLFNMENGLIAKDINNAAKDRPNMSLKYSDEHGKVRGYILAWEGHLSDEDMSDGGGEFFGKPCLYISDLATDRETRMAGGRLIGGFAQLYKQNYLDKGNPIPIFAQAREATSYQIVKKQLDAISKDIGFNFELIELPTHKAGKDVMHPIIIRPTKEVM